MNNREINIKIAERIFGAKMNPAPWREDGLPITCAFPGTNFPCFNHIPHYSSTEAWDVVHELLDGTCIDFNLSKVGNLWKATFRGIDQGLEMFSAEAENLHMAISLAALKTMREQE